MLEHELISWEYQSASRARFAGDDADEYNDDGDVLVTAQGCCNAEIRSRHGSKESAA